ncbi:MAG: GPW/gp25 family protein [Deltaproteobacteria bacterium]|nr:GPW/gp25 family protein [Deltaproteobacteria bacterium]
MPLSHPFRFDDAGRTATSVEPEFIEELIELVLFTGPGERVNRPDFGTGVMGLVFAGGGTEVAAATNVMLQGALERWLGERIVIARVDVQQVDAELRATVVYTDRRSERRHTVTTSRGI